MGGDGDEGKVVGRRYGGHGTGQGRSVELFRWGGVGWDARSRGLGGGGCFGGDEGCERLIWDRALVMVCGCERCLMRLEAVLGYSRSSSSRDNRIRHLNNYLIEINYKIYARIEKKLEDASIYFSLST